MSLTRDSLQAHLVAFAGMADAIADEAGAGDRCWVEDQAVAMLERRGLVSPAEGEA